MTRPTRRALTGVRISDDPVKAFAAEEDGGNGFGSSKEYRKSYLNMESS